MAYNDPDHQTSDETLHLLTQLTRIGFAVDKELTLMSERMSWLVMSESFIFSAFTIAAINRDKTAVLEILVVLMPVIGFLLALTVYPALLAAHWTAKEHKAERHRFEQKLPEPLRVKLHAKPWEHFLGSIPAVVIPAMLLLVWLVIIGTVMVVPRG